MCLLSLPHWQAASLPLVPPGKCWNRLKAKPATSMLWQHHPGPFSLQTIKLSERESARESPGPPFPFYRGAPGKGSLTIARPSSASHSARCLSLLFQAAEPRWQQKAKTEQTAENQPSAPGDVRAETPLFHFFFPLAGCVKSLVLKETNLTLYSSRFPWPPVTLTAGFHRLRSVCREARRSPLGEPVPRLSSLAECACCEARASRGPFSLLL